jgi:hypothetical protein
MKKHHILGLAFLAIFAFSAVLAATASAETTLLAEWEIKAAPVMTLTSVKTTGTITLINLLVGVKVAEIFCEGAFVGSVGANGEGEVTEVLDKAGNKIGMELVGTSLSCESLLGNSSFGCNAAELAEVWTDNLPWHSLLFLMEDGTFLNQLQGSPGYHVLCVTTKVENLCVGETFTKMTNEPTDVRGEFEESTLPEASCNKIGKGMLIGSGLVETLNGETLAVSSV